MKTIRWIGAVIFASAVAVASVLLIGQPTEAAPGDPIVVLVGNEVTMTAPQRTCYNQWVQSVLPNAQLANLVRVECDTIESRTECQATDSRTLTAAQYARAEEEGRLQGTPSPADIAEDGSTVTVTRQSDEKTLTPEQQASLDTCNASAFGTSNVASFYLRRSGSTLIGAAETVVAVSPAQRLLQIRNELNARRVGTVQ